MKSDTRMLSFFLHFDVDFKQSLDMIASERYLMYLSLEDVVSTRKKQQEKLPIGTTKA